MFSKKILKKVSLYISLSAIVFLNLAILPGVFALTYSNHVSVLQTNMTTSAGSALVVSFTGSGSNTGTAISLTFTGWTGGANGAVLASQTYAQTYGPSSVSCKTITGASNFLPGSPTASGNAGTGVITLASVSALTGGQSYCFVLGNSSGTNAVTNPTSANPYSVSLVLGSDTATVGIDVIANDQITVSATVLPSFTMALGGSTDSLGTLSSGAVNVSTGVTVTVNTNASYGWNLFGYDTNAGLVSATASKTIAWTTPGGTDTLSNGSEGYVTGIPAAGITQGTGVGTTSAVAPYNSNGTTTGSGLDGNLRKVATSTGTAGNAIVTLKELASIAGTTPAAADYADTLTLVGAGTF